MGKKDASATGLPVEQYRKQIGKQDYKKTKLDLKLTRLKAEAKKNSSGFKPGTTQMKRNTKGTWRITTLRDKDSTEPCQSRAVPDAFLVIAAIAFFVLCVYAFFYLNLSTELDLDVDVD